jgi:hypothetical protein
MRKVVIANNFIATFVKFQRHSSLSFELNLDVGLEMCSRAFLIANQRGDRH